MVLSNDQMKANRYGRWAVARKLIRHIVTNLEAGNDVYLCTYTKATRYQRKHAAMFKANRNGAWVQRGKSWVCINFTPVRIVEN